MRYVEDRFYVILYSLSHQYIHICEIHMRYNTTNPEIVTNDILKSDL